VVAAKNAAQPKEIPMTKAKSNRKSTSHSQGRNSEAQTTAHKAAKLKPSKPPARQLPQSSSQPKDRTESKQARIIAMLRTPSGATIEAMMQATGWQQHSVRGFLAAVVRKKLGLNLVSVKEEAGRIYRIADRMALPVAAAKTSQAA
jgi:hypothetical protein